MSTGKQKKCVGKFRMIFLGIYMGVWILNISGHMQKEGSMKTLERCRCCTELIMAGFIEFTFFWFCVLVHSPWIIHLASHFPVEYSMGLIYHAFGNIWKWLHFISTSAELLHYVCYFWIANSYHFYSHTHTHRDTYICVFLLK